MESLMELSNLMKQMMIDDKRVTRKIIVTTFLVSSNMFLNCFFGPHKNMEEKREMRLPTEYMRTKGTGFPCTR